MEEKKGKIKKGSKLYIGIIGIIFACLVAVYLLFGLYYTKHFFQNVKINEMDVSGMTTSQVRSDLEQKAVNYSLAIHERNAGEEVLYGKDFDLELSYEDTLESILKDQQVWKWGKHLFVNTEYELNVLADYDASKLESQIASLSCADSKNMVEPEDAYLDYDEDNGLMLIPEVAGSKVDKNKLYAQITEAVENARSEISLDEAGVYVNPSVTKDDEALNAKYNLWKPYIDTKITYHFGDDTEVLDATVFYDWMTETKNGKITFDEDKAKEYVKGLARKYNTAYSPKTLKTSYGETVTIKTGSYGWQINQGEETTALIEALMSCESQDREPVYTQTAASHTGNDYGDTYVEVNLSAQHLFFYKDGELLIETDFVSGNASKGWSTPDGAYPLTYKQRDATLRGENYATPVSYWMPFNGNIGLHDSTWRSTYGKNIYKKNGSHGCINLPPSAAKVIFENIEKGMPVLCYYLSGTEYPDEPEDDEALAAEQEPEIDSSQETPVEIPQENQQEQVPSEVTVPAQETITVPDVPADEQNNAEPLQAVPEQ